MRDRIWDVVTVWCGVGGDLSVVMTWPEPRLPGGQGVRTLGTPPVELVEHNGVFLARRALTEDDVRSLTTRFGGRVARNEERSAAALGAAVGLAMSDEARQIDPERERESEVAAVTDAVGEPPVAGSPVVQHSAPATTAENESPAPSAPGSRSPPQSKT